MMDCEIILDIAPTSYTWKDEYLLPYESYWSRVAKFSFLNGLSWSYVQNNDKLKQLIHKPMYFNSFFTKIPPFNLAESIKYDSNYIFQSKYKVYKMCPICMRYAYHSVLHEIEGLNYCVFHKCDLIKIDGNAFYASRNGTYEFISVKAEDIVRNGTITKEIDEFVRKHENQRYISNNYFFIDSIKKKCYESTERLYQNKILLQDDIGLYGCKCIGFMRREEVVQINDALLEKFISSYIKNVEEKDFLYHNLQRDGLKSFIIKNYISENEHGEKIIKESLLGWCFITVASEVIRKFFDNLDDWKITYNSLYDNTISNINIQNKTKIAVILAVQAITGTTSPDVVQRPDSWYWAQGHSMSKCNLPIYFDLGRIVHSVPFRNGSCTKAGQYIVYPVIKDLFYDLIYRASNLLEQNFNVTYDKRLIRNILYDLQIVPQYAVFYYMDRVEIYRCDSENE